MSTFSALLGISSGVLLLGWILFLLFAQVTVRRLEKNPDTREVLGVEFVSGWRIFNVAEALVLPMAFFRLANRGPLGFLYADAEKLREHARPIDRVLAHLFVWPFVAGAGSMVLLVVLNGVFGVFD